MTAHKKLPPYNQAVKELLEGIPDLLELSTTEGNSKIEEFLQTWKSPSSTFNAYLYFSICKHNQKYFIQ